MPTQVEVIQQPGPRLQRQPLEAGKQEVGFDGKVVVGCLQEVASADALDLTRHTPLAVQVANVFDDRIREDDVEGVGGERRQVGGVADHALEARMFDSLRVQVEDSESDARLVGEAHPLPEVLRAADVENSQRPGHAVQQIEEELEPPPPHRSGIGIILTIVGKSLEQHSDAPPK